MIQIFDLVDKHAYKRVEAMVKCNADVKIETILIWYFWIICFYPQISEYILIINKSYQCDDLDCSVQNRLL